MPGEIPGSGRCLPALADASGPAGPATHLAVAYGLGARGLKDRVGAVDALLTLAATGALDAGRFGKDIAAPSDAVRSRKSRIWSKSPPAEVPPSSFSRPGGS